MKLRNTALSALALGMALAATSASAATVSGSFDVTATVTGSCIISAAENIQFGSYDPTNAHASANLDAAGSISVRCTAGSTNVKVALDEGLNASAESAPGAPVRQMAAGDNRLQYQIFQDAGRTQAWGEDDAAVTMDEFVSSLTPVQLTTYGRIVGGQNAAIGTYSDTVAVTVTF